MSTAFVISGGLDDALRQQIESFFDNLKQTVLDQAKIGTMITLDMKPKFVDVTDPVFYGNVPVDRRYAGCRWVVDIPNFAVMD